MPHAIIFFADGFEECEGLIVVDLLRRAGIKVTTASVNGKETVVSSHKVEIRVDTQAEKADYDSADIIVLPGGMPGTKNLAVNRIVSEQCRNFAREKYVAAICAAPSVLGSLGLLKGKKATCYPSFERMLEGAFPTYEDVTVDGNIITGRALGAAIPFGLEIITALLGADASRNVAEQICLQ